MNFSEVFKQTGHLAKFSPNGLTLANAIQHRLLVRDVKTLEVIQIFACVDEIEDVQWSPDSSLVMCAMFKHGRVQVWSLEDPSWICRVDEGSVGLISVRWSPDSRHILATADFHLRITVWSLVNKSVSYMKYPKPVEMNMSFSQNGNYLALLERRNCKDHVTIFSCSTWQLLMHFEPETNDAAGISFAPDGNCVCLWESLFEYKIVLYSLNGHCISSFVPTNATLGVKTVSWSLSGQFLAVGSFDQKIHVLNNIIWKPVVEFQHNETITTSSIIVYKEVEKSRRYEYGARFESSTSAKYDVISDRPLSIPVSKVDVNKLSTRIGISLTSFSPDNKYLMTRNDNMPASLWIWSMQELKLLTILIQVRPIKYAEWEPSRSRLALCSGSNKLYLWTPAGSTAVEIPNQANFEICGLSWHPRGDTLLLIGKDQMCVCFFEQ